MQQKRTGCSGTLGLIFFGVIIIFAWAEFTKKPDTQSNRPQAASQPVIAQTVENRLAELELGHGVSDSDQRVIKFRSLLRSLNSKTGTPEDDIADMTVRGQNVFFKQTNKHIGLLQLMESVNNSIPDSAKGTLTYADAVALYITAYNALNS